MSRQLLTLTPERETLKQLVAADPSGLHSLSVPIQPNQGVLRFGAFISSDGTRAVIPSQVLGVLPVSLDTDELPERTLRPNRRFHARQISVGAYQVRQSILRFRRDCRQHAQGTRTLVRAMFTGRPDYWIGP